MFALRTDDCIVAISSPAGRALRGLVRVTGPEAIALCAKKVEMADSTSISQQPVRRLIPCRLRLEPAVVVPCNCVIFLPPASYTGQPLVELHVAGAPALLEMAVRALLAAGARLAGPGEFTARAFLTGRMDLPGAEAVAARIAARSDAQLAAAQQLAGGHLSQRIGAAVEELTDLLSLVEAGIDFADEPVDFIDGATLLQRLLSLQDSLRQLLARSLDMQRLEVLPRVALAGPMSAGKSCLVNRLSGLDRSICSPIPGTTRDALCAVLDTPAGQVLLLDGPGLGSPRSDIDRLAQDAWCELLARVDLLMVVLPADQLYDAWLGRSGHPPDSDVMADLQTVIERATDLPSLWVLNKQDLLDNVQQQKILEAAARNLPAAGSGRALHLVSAKTGAGCDLLPASIGSAIVGLGSTSQGKIVLTARHREALQTGLREMGQAVGLLTEQPPLGSATAGMFPAELVALHLREAAGQMGQITGAVTTEDLLERVFSRFCIGK